MSQTNKNTKTNKWVLSLLWLFAVTLAFSYMKGYNLFPITEWVRSIFEPIHISIFGESS